MLALSRCDRHAHARSDQKEDGTCCSEHDMACPVTPVDMQSEHRHLENDVVGYCSVTVQACTKACVSTLRQHVHRPYLELPQTRTLVLSVHS